MAPVRVTHRYNQPPDRVFDAWLNPALASKFFFATRTGSILLCEIDATVGGQFLVTDRRPHADEDESFFHAEHRGTYVEIERPHRLAFDMGVEPYAAAITRVTIDIVPLGVSMCEIVLTHNLGQNVDRAVAERDRQGWERMLDQLDKVLGTRVRF